MRFLTLAGDQALDSGGFDEALRQFDDALSIQEEDDQHQIADLRYKKGHALQSLGRGEAAVEEWLHAITIYERLDDGEAVARTVYDTVSRLLWRRDTAQARTLSQRGLDFIGASREVDRCRLLASLGFASSMAGDKYDVSHDAIEHAQEIAGRLDRPELTATVLSRRTFFHFCYMQFPEAVEAGRRAAEQLRALGKLWEVCEVSGPMDLALLYRGRFHEVLELDTQLEDLATRVGHRDSRFMTLFCRTFHQLMTTENHAGSGAFARRYVEFTEEEDIGWLGFSHLLLGRAHFCSGDWAGARSEFRDADRLIPSESFFGGMMPSVITLTRAYAGDHDALAPLQAYRSEILAIGEDAKIGTWQMVPNVVEALATLGHLSLVADCYVHVRKALDKGTVIAINLQLWQMVAGIAAGAGEQWDVAQAHFETALRQAHDLPHKTARPEVRRWYAQMLLDRNGAGDRDKARTLLGEAVEMYRTLGMPKHLEMAERMFEEL